MASSVGGLAVAEPSGSSLTFVARSNGNESGCSPLVSGNGKTGCMQTPPKVIGSIIKVLLPSREVLKLALCSELGLLGFFRHPFRLVLV